VPTARRTEQSGLGDHLAGLTLRRVVPALLLLAAGGTSCSVTGATAAASKPSCGSHVVSLSTPLDLFQANWSSIGVPGIGTGQGGAQIATVASTGAPFSITKIELVDPKNMVLKGGVVLPYTPKNAPEVGPGNFLGSITSLEGGDGPGILWDELESVPTRPIDTGAGAADLYVVAARQRADGPSTAAGEVVTYEVGGTQASVTLSVCLQMATPQPSS
jgi:hypothetical protein